MSDNVIHYPFPGLEGGGWGSLAHVNAVAAWLVKERKMSLDDAAGFANRMILFSEEFAKADLREFWVAWFRSLVEDEYENAAG